MCNTTLWFTEEDNLCFRQGKAAMPEVFNFPLFPLFCRAWEISHAVSMAAAPQLYVHRPICWQPTASSCTHSGFLAFFLSFLGFVPALLTLYLIPFVYIPASNLHLFPFLLSLPLAISSTVKRLMWDHKWSSLTSISGYQGSIRVAQYQAGHSASLTLSQGEWAAKWNALNSSHVNMALRLP